MTQFYVNFLMQDDHGRRTRKQYQTIDYAGVDAGADFLSALAAAQALSTSLAVLSELAILALSIRYEETVVDGVTSGANKDEGATLTVSKVGTTKRATMKVPGPQAGVRNADGSIDVTAVAVTDFIAHFQTGGDFLISDGEVVDDVILGKLDK